VADTQRYQPTHCNIGTRGRKQRLAVAVVAFGLSLLYVLAVAVGILPDPLLVGVFVPLSIGFEWGLQAYKSFCVRLAMLGRYDFRGEGGQAGSVPTPDDRRADRVEAVKVTVIAVVLAAATTGALTLVLA